MARRTTEGTCRLCGETFTKGRMARHLKSCIPKHAAPESAGSSASTSFFHLQVEGRRRSQYWLHLEVSAQAALEDLDTFLRGIWLECCGHLSAFSIAGTDYYAPEAGRLQGERMDVPLEEVLRPGLGFTHEYDFGTPTELVLQVEGEWEQASGSARPVQLLARNEPPSIPCQCGRAATQLCPLCVYEGEGWFCEDCGGRHECEEEMWLPVVNSPRVGVCGYSG